MIKGADQKQLNRFIKPTKNENGNSSVAHVRIDFGKMLENEQVQENLPELALHVRLVRARVMQLQSSFRRDSNAARKWFDGVTSATILLSIIGIGGGAASAIYDSYSSLFAALSIALGFIAGLLAAGTAAFGLHKRYAAMLSAYWKMVALRIRIDQEVLEVATACVMAGEIDDSERARFGKNVKEWVKKIDLVLSSFGKEYGSSIAPVKLQNRTTSN